MDLNTVYYLIMGILTVIGLIRYCVAANDSNGGCDWWSFEQSENNFDFNLVFYLLVIGVIVMLVWLCFGGLGTPVKTSAAPLIPQTAAPAAASTVSPVSNVLTVSRDHKGKQLLHHGKAITRGLSKHF